MRCRMLLILTMVSGVLFCRPCVARDWLTKGEQDFFAAFGAVGKVEGKAVLRRTRLDQLSEIAKKSPEPLQDRIKVIAEAMRKMPMTVDESQRLKATFDQAKSQLHSGIEGVVAGILGGSDPKQAAGAATKDFLKGGAIQAGWKVQTEWLNRLVKSRQTIDEQMLAITEDFEGRTDHKALDEGSLTWSVEWERGSLHLKGISTAPLTQPVVRVRGWRRPGSVDWLGVNGGVAQFVPNLGVAGVLDAATLEAGTAYASALDKAASFPSETWFLLPTLTEKAKVDLDLHVSPAETALWDRVEVAVWAGEGTAASVEAEGVAAAVEAAVQTGGSKTASGGLLAMNLQAAGVDAGTISTAAMIPGLDKLLAREMKPVGLPPDIGGGPERAIATATSGTGASPATASQKKAAQLQAAALVKQGVKLLARKETEKAKACFQEAIAVAPDSPGAKTAREKLKDLSD